MKVVFESHIKSLTSINLQSRKDKLVLRYIKESNNSDNYFVELKYIDAELLLLNMNTKETELELLIEKYRLEKLEIEKEYGKSISFEYENNGCCMKADIRARMDCLQVFYRELKSLKK